MDHMRRPASVSTGYLMSRKETGSEHDDASVLQGTHGGSLDGHERERRVRGGQKMTLKKWRCRTGRRYSSELPTCTLRMRRLRDAGRVSTVICSVSDGG